MRSKDILKAMGRIDSRLIDEALDAEAKNISEDSEFDLTEDEYYPEIITEMKAPPKRIGIFKWAGLAAAVSAITAGAVLLSQLQQFNGIISSAGSAGISTSTVPPVSVTTETSEPAATESADNSIIFSEPFVESREPSDNSPDNKIEILPNGLPDVPLAQLTPFDEYFTAERLDHVNTDSILPEFIADGDIYCTHYNTSPEREETMLSILRYVPEEDVMEEVLRDVFPENDPVSYHFLCVYGDYLYFYRSTPLSETIEWELKEGSPNADTKSYMLCSVNLVDGSTRIMRDVDLELLPNLSDCVFYGGYMFFEEITETDLETGKYTYNISQMDLENGSVSSWENNARCPLLYGDNIVFYRDGAFWISDIERTDEHVLFYDTLIDFYKDRLCSDGRNIVLARNYTEYREDSNQYSAFTIEVYDERVNGFAPAALFNDDVISTEHFSIVDSSPLISHADGLFGFLDIIFDPETNVFVQTADLKDWPRMSKIVMADDKIYYCEFNYTWDESVEDPVSDSHYYLFVKKEELKEYEQSKLRRP